MRYQPALASMTGWNHVNGYRVGFTEIEVREQVKQAGGKWNRNRRVWELRYAQVIALKLEPRIVEEEASNTR